MKKGFSGTFDQLDEYLAHREGKNHGNKNK